MLTSAFLNHLTGKNIQTFRCINSHFNPIYNKKSRRARTFKDRTLESVQPYLENHYRDIFVSVSGLTNNIRIDIDGNPHLEDILGTCHKLDIQPNYLMNTTNGYHLFFIFTRTIRDGVLADAKQKLNFLLGGDETALYSEAYRLPNTYSYSNRWSPTYCQLEMLSMDSIQFEPFADKIGALKEEDWLDMVFGAASCDTDLSPLSPFPIVCPTVKPSRKVGFDKDDLYDNRKAVLLAARQSKSMIERYVGKTGEYICCPYHNDKNPSATIKQFNGVYLFGCFKCKLNKDLIELIKWREGLRGTNLINRIMELMGRDDLVIDSCSYNPLSILPIVCPILEQVPQNLVTSELKTVISTLDKYLTYRKKHLDQWGVFFISQNYLAKQARLHPSTCSRVMNILCYLGVLDKISFDQVPVGLYQKTIKGASVSFFRLNHITTAVHIETRLMALKAAKINRKNFSCKRLEEAFGETEARRVYPDYYDVEETKNLKSKSEFLSLVPPQSNEEIEKMIASLTASVEEAQEKPEVT